MLIPVSIHKVLAPPEMLDDSGPLFDGFPSCLEWPRVRRGFLMLPSKEIGCSLFFVEDFLTVRTTLLTINDRDVSLANSLIND